MGEKSGYVTDEQILPYRLVMTKNHGDIPILSVIRN